MFVIFTRLMQQAVRTTNTDAEVALKYSIWNAVMRHLEVKIVLTVKNNSNYTCKFYRLLLSGTENSHNEAHP